MTVATIKQNVANNLGDSSFVQFTEDAILASIQDAYSVVVAKTLCIQRSINFPQMPNQVYYRFGDYFPDILAISAIFNYNTNRWLIPVDRRELDELRWDWENMTGEPRWFSPENYQLTSIIPHLVSPVSGFQIFYRAKAETLTDLSIPQIPIQAIQALEFFATGDQFESIREFTKAAEWKQLFKQKIPEIKIQAKKLAFADKVDIFGAGGMGTFAFTGVTDNVWTGNETPTGSVNGVNTIFTLAAVPSPTSTLIVIWNGVVQAINTGFTLSGRTITFIQAIPQTGDTIRAWYQT